MYSPEEFGNLGIPGYMPFTSHRFKRIDVYFTVLKPGKRISCFYTAAMIDPLFRGARLFCAAGLFSGEGQQPIPCQTFFLNGGYHFFHGVPDE